MLGHAGTANRRIIFDSKQEAGHQTADRIWRRWEHFCYLSGLDDNPFLTHLPSTEKELILRSFLQLYRDASWNPDGKLTGRRRKPVVSSTVRDAASRLAAAFRHHNEPSPVHLANSSLLCPTIRSLLRAFDNNDPPPNRQKAITPRLLRRLYSASGAFNPLLRDCAPAVVADLLIGAWFFAMRSCEFTHTPTPGRTKIINLAGIIFRDSSRRIISHADPKLLSAEFVTLVFEDQKNGTKRDARSQRRTNQKILCPVTRWGSIVQRIRRTIPAFSDDTTINTIRVAEATLFISNTYTKKTLRTTCSLFGGKATFGFAPHEIGNKSIRSGAAMALFLADVPTAKIMILGRWSSDAFLVYIRPQVLEWTSNMSRDMTKLDSFLDVGADHTRAHQSDPRTKTRSLRSINGSFIVLPRFHLQH